MSIINDLFHHQHTCSHVVGIYLKKSYGITWQPNCKITIISFHAFRALEPWMSLKTISARPTWISCKAHIKNIIS